MIGSLIGLIGLTALLIILSVDNAVFISIIAGRLPSVEQPRARKLGLFIALLLNLLLVSCAGFIKQLSEPLFTIASFALSVQDLLLLAGGLVLIAKATSEIHDKLEGSPAVGHTMVEPSLGKVLTQIAVINLVFSIDSVLTAVGMADELWVMLSGVVISGLFLVACGEFIGTLVTRHPTLKVLALSFLILIGSNLLVEALHVHIPKGYTYFAMAFSLGVEILNLRIKAASYKPVALNKPHLPSNPPTS